LRVCGVSAEAVYELEAAQVHIDVIPERLSTLATFATIEDYAGGRDSLRALNFLIPGRGEGPASLVEALRKAGARADLVPTYRTSIDQPALARISALIAGGGVDCIAFTSPSEVRDLAAVLDLNDLGRLMAGIAVACVDKATVQTAADFSLTADIIPPEASLSVLAEAIGCYFPR